MKLGRYRAFLAISFITLTVVGSVRAQKTPSEPSDATPVFKSRSQMVQVPVVVQDHRGSHVSGLTKNDFVVKENGAERKIVICDEVKTSAAPIARARTQKDQSSFSNVQQGHQAQRIVILALDTINTPLVAQANARKQLLKYLSDAVAPDELVSLIIIKRGGVRVIHDFTTDPSVLSAALKRVRGAKSDVETIELQTPEDSDPALESEVDALTELEQGEAETGAEQKRMAILDTLGAMQQIAQRYAGIEGRKALIWVTAGFPFSVSDSNGMISGATGAGLDDVLSDYEHVWTLFNAANIAVYPVDVRGLENPAWMDATVSRISPRGAVPQKLDRHQDSLDTFRSFAEMTGGRAFYDTNDLAGSFRAAAQDSASYYMLGYYLDHNAQPGWHALKVGVRNHAGTARARDGFFVESDEAKARQSDVAQALTSPVDFTAIPLTLRWDSRLQLSNSSKTKISFEIELGPDALNVDSSDNNHVNFQVFALAKRADGTPDAKTAKSVDAHLKLDTATRAHEKGMAVRESLELASGNYTVRAVVFDKLSGRVGSVSAPIEVQ